MAEDLFRFLAVRSPGAPEPRYSPISLAQGSTFQVDLRNAVAADRDNPRKALYDVSTAYIASSSFAPLAEDDPNNIKLENAAKVINTLGGLDVGSTAQPVNHANLVDLLKMAFSTTDLANLETWFNPLEERLKDSIVALRLLGVEQDTGNLAFLARRLRTIGVTRKATADINFPFNDVDLRKYNLRPLHVPTFVELKPIISTAGARATAIREEEEKRAKTQGRIDNLYQARFRLRNALNEIVKLPATHRAGIEPRPFKPRPPPAEITQIPLTTRNLELAHSLAKLTLQSFEAGVGGRGPVPQGQQGEAEDDPQTLAAEPGASSNIAIINPLVNMSKTLLDSFQQLHPQPRATPSFVPSKVIPFALLQSAQGQLSTETQDVLRDMALEITAKPIDGTVDQIRQQLRANADALDALYAPYVATVSKVQHVGGLRVRHKKPATSPWQNPFLEGSRAAPVIYRRPFDFPTTPAGRITVLGVADLLVVKQQLIGYEGGDVAYIENVLKGETKSREVTHKTSVDIETMLETEDTLSMDADKTTTERFEVSNESSNIIQNEESAKAGVTMSASYGPTVSVSAHADFSSDRSSTEAVKAATRYSKDITFKATEKISKRVLARSTTRSRTEASTKDLHSLSNASTDHVAGVYQWLNKVYEAQVWNYGKRIMLDFMVPEPGAFYLDKQTQPEAAGDSIEIVDKFELQPEQIHEGNYLTFGVLYGITDLDPPPKEISRASASYAAGPDEPHAKAGKIVIPAGFEVAGATITAQGVPLIEKEGNWVIVTCGTEQWPWDPTEEPNAKTAFPRILSITQRAGRGEVTSEEGHEAENEIPWCVTAAWMHSFAITIEVLLERTSEAEIAWRNKTWTRIRVAADKLLAAQKAEVEQVKYNSAFQGRNPEKNKVIMRNEMKKNCISIMTDSHYDEFGAIQKSRTSAFPNDMPIWEIDIDNAPEQGMFVRFFEQAFEWEEMTWMLYPYFWGRKEQWYRRVDYEDEDPDFEKFIQAGFARVNVPVRPGFEGALEHYLGTSQVWDGGPLPGVSSSTFLPLATEIQESLGKKAEEPVKYGDPWLVKVPTNLLRLRKDDKVPVWTKDSATGQWIEVQDTQSRTFATNGKSGTDRS